MAHPRKNQQKKTSASSPLFDNFRFEAKTQSQAEAQFDFEDGKHLILTGYAGTGKSYASIAIGLKQLIAGKKRKIRLIRAAQATKDIGFLPGTEAEKLEVFERAFSQVFNELLRRGDGYECLKKADLVEFNSTSYLRGLTFKDEVIIVDECQNLSESEIDCIVTRVGHNTQIIFCGDERQSDLRFDRGFGLLKKIGNNLPQHFSIFFSDAEDILRSGLVKDYILLVSGTLI